MMQSRFQTKKKQIVDLINVPHEVYTDLSPKGSIDEPIRPLISDINRLEGLVTTSSCSGRISVFLEGRKNHTGDTEAHDYEDESRAGPGGKGGGGSWLFISHDPINVPLSTSEMHFVSVFGLRNSYIGMESEPVISSRFIHLKFEPMILHILCSSLQRAHKILNVAMSSGFRESGALSITPTKSGETNPMVAVRSAGYAFDAIIGYQTEGGDNVPLVDENYLRILVKIANERFKINTERIQRFHSSLMEESKGEAGGRVSGSKRNDWEDPEVRRERKRKEGLLHQQALREMTTTRSRNEPKENRLDN